MSIIHVVLAKVDPKLLQDGGNAVYDEFRTMLDAVPVTKHEVHVGPPMNPSMSGGYNFMSTMKFDSMDDFKKYLDHPKHMEMKRKFKPPVMTDMLAYQIMDPPSESKL